MTDPLGFSIVVIVGFIGAAAAMRWFKTLDRGFGRAARTSIVTGLISGAVILLADGTKARTLAIGITLTLSALYVRLTGDESEPSEGMLFGGVTGAAATVPLLLLAADPARHLAENLLAGGMAGLGITFAALHVVSRGRQLILDAVTGALAVGAAALPGISGIASRDAAVAVAAALPLLVLATVFKQWPDVRAELLHEASLGFIDDADVRRTANPFLRLGKGGWRDRTAHREFVRLANRIALRKRQQRHRPEEVARLYQLEIIKLRMQIQEMSRINTAVAAQGGSLAEEEGASDTMASRRHEA
jgi:uncharacterized membrane protein YeaQ/YmgE (transglycosylase-associated protein family)